MTEILIQRLRKAEQDATTCANLGEHVLQQQAELTAKVYRDVLNQKR